MMRVRGVLLDLDGTLYQDDRVVPGAAEAVARLRRAGLPLRYVTNTTRLPRAALVDRLRGFGFMAHRDELVTAPVAAAAWLRAHRLHRIALCVPEPTLADFEGFDLDDVRPEAVVVGDLGARWTFERLDHAFRWVLAGARLVALQKNRYWQTPDGLSLDVGPFVVALEYAAGVTATVVGKPSREFFLAASGSMGLNPHEVAMIGDDVFADVAGAQDAGARGVLVRTGKYRAGDETAAGRAPDAVIESVVGVPGLLGA